MPSNTLSHADRPDLIRVEGQAIEAKFERLSPTTGRISWNLPVPANGCDAGSRAYNGVVVTGGIRPADQTTSPVNGQFYRGDRTLDEDLHAGDKIGHSKVVLAVYNDVVTTFVDVTDLDSKAPYYFSVYAVDNVLNYYRPGVHTYSAGLATGLPEEKGNPAYQAILFPNIDFENAENLPTGLNPAQNFTVELEINCKKHTLTIPGADALSYTELQQALNRELDKLDDAYQGFQAPNTGTLYLNLQANTLQRWQGNGYDPIELFHNGTNAPNQPVLNQYWHDTKNHRLWQWNGTAWLSRPFIEYSADPALPSCGMFLFNGTTVFRWDGAGWCAVQTFVQQNNPFIPDLAECAQYWFDETEYNLNKRVGNTWQNVAAIYSDVNPNILPTGTHWFDSTNQRVYRRASGAWVAAAGVSIDNHQPTMFQANSYWYNPTTQVLKQRNILNTEWEDRVCITFHEDPSARGACDLWWEAATDILREWDSLNQEWAVVENFIIADYDPGLGVVVDQDAVWFNPVTGQLYTWEGLCDPVSVLWYIGGDPRDMADGTIWYNTIDKKFRIRASGAWTVLDVTSFPSDPNMLPLGMFWYNGTSLFQWNGTTWNEVMFVTRDVTPALGFKWFNLSDDTLYVWNGVRWEVSRGKASVVTFHAKKRECVNCRVKPPINGWRQSGFYFITEESGSDKCIKLTGGNLWQSMNTIVTLVLPVEGTDGVNPLPPYMQEGVGTDGSEEERKMLQRDVILALGGGGVNVELTKEDLDHSIDRALRELRRRAAPYTRGYFPINTLHDRKKKFLLTNKQLGHNKIIRVIGVYRATGMWPAAADGGINSYTNPMMFGMLGGKPGGDMLTYTMLSMYIDEMETVLARKISFFFNERSRVLEIHNATGAYEPLLIEGTIETPEQEIMMDRRYRSWIERWAVAESQMKLAEIRGKFQTIPGPNGGVVMNAGELRQAATEAFTALLKEIDDFIVVDPTEFPNAFFTVG